jgi:catechol 2,3-dioxygenase-like lactoylglutathione lyase family enzyme
MQDLVPLTVGVDHIGLTVRNLEQTRLFFCDCLGWHVIGENASYPAVFVSDGQDRVTLWQISDPDNCSPFDRRVNLGLHHLALKVADLPSLHSTFARVAAWPDVVVEFSPELVGNGPRVHCMINEPGGLRIELVCHPKS